MIDDKKLQDVLSCYKKDFVNKQWQEEKYKWEAIKNFQDNWDIDSADFAEMLKRSLSKTKNLLVSQNYFPARMIEVYAQIAPNEVKEMFVSLYDESEDVVERIVNFRKAADNFCKKYRDENESHYQFENAISIYLWLRYPDKYYIYKYGVVKDVASKLGTDLKFTKGHNSNNLRNFYELYNEICEKVNADDELKSMFNSQLTDDCYKDANLRTLTSDIGFYISKHYDEQNNKEENNKNYWWMNANPKIWSFSNIAVGEKEHYTLYNENGNKRRIFENFLAAKEGDEIICYESTPVKQIVGIGRITKENDGERIYFEKVENLISTIDLATLQGCPELQQMEYFVNPQGSLFKLKKEEYDFIMDMIREMNPLETTNKTKELYSRERFLNDVYISEEKYNHLKSVLLNKKNIILQGAPGVGKTFVAKRLAYSIMGEKDDSRIEFVQFHQNYSYEDFVMGYKPEGNSFELKYGIFYRFCQKATNNPNKEYFFIIDEINRGNMSKIFGELLMLIEKDYRGTNATLAYNGLSFSVPKNLYIIGMMNTADRSLAMIDYALRRRFSFFDMEPAFNSEGFIKYQKNLNNKTFDLLIEKIVELNNEIMNDKSLGNGFCFGHSYFCGVTQCTTGWMMDVVDFDILPMLAEYWFDDLSKVEHWKNILHGVF